jgi:valyl-tRNA synthetase
MMSCSPAGGDLLFDEKLCEQGRNFCNKIWNALRLVDGWEADENVETSLADQLSLDWITHKMNSLIVDIEKNFVEYRLSEALMSIYSFVWTDFCSWYLEMIKPPYEEKISAKTKANTLQLFSNIAAMMHPFMPFITEEIWHALKSRNEGDDCIVSSYPKVEYYDQKLIDRVEQAKEIITGIRDIRNKHGIKMKDELDFYIVKSTRSSALIDQAGWKEIVLKSGNLGNITITDDENIAGITFISGTEKCIVVVHQEMDIDAQMAEKKTELTYQEGFVASVMKKLDNERFVSSAPLEVVEKERAKLADGQERIKLLNDEILRLKALMK